MLRAAVAPYHWGGGNPYRVKRTSFPRFTLLKSMTSATNFRQILRRPLAALSLMVLLALPLALAGCDGAVTTGPELSSAKENAPASAVPARPPATSSQTIFENEQIEVALLGEGETARYACTVRTANSEAADGYVAWHLGLTFPEKTVAATGGETTPIAYRLHRTASREEAQSYVLPSDSTEAWQDVSLDARCRLPRSEDVLTAVRDLIHAAAWEHYGFARTLGAEEGASTDDAPAVNTAPEELPRTNKMGLPDDPVDCPPGYTYTGESCSIDEVVVTPDPPGEDPPSDDPPSLPDDDVPPPPEDPGGPDEGNGSIPDGPCTQSVSPEQADALLVGNGAETQSMPLPPPGEGGHGGIGGGPGDGGSGECGDDGSEGKADVYPPATRVEVAELIRQECKAAPGVNLPSDDSRFSGWFQASVRKSINAAEESGDEFKQDPGTEFKDGSSAHPQLTDRVDGYAESAHDYQFNEYHGIVTALLEVKFSERPGNQLSRRQYKKHIEDLAKYYELIPQDGDLRQNAPHYVIASNSVFPDRYGHKGVENLGPKKSHMLRYAEERGVNVSHIRITKDSDGSFYLEGDFLGSPVNPATWLADVIKDHKIPFKVECQKED